METGRKGKNGNTGTRSSCHFRHYLLQKIKKNQDMLGKALDDRESQVKEGGIKCLGAGTAFLDMSHMKITCTWMMLSYQELLGLITPILEKRAITPA